MIVEYKEACGHLISMLHAEDLVVTAVYPVGARMQGFLGSESASAIAKVISQHAEMEIVVVGADGSTSMRIAEDEPSIGLVTFWTVSIGELTREAVDLAMDAYKAKIDELETL